MWGGGGGGGGGGEWKRARIYFTSGDFSRRIRIVNLAD